MLSAVSVSADRLVKTTPPVALPPPGRAKPTVLEHSRSLEPPDGTMLTWSVRTDGCSRNSCRAGSACSFAVSSAAGATHRPVLAPSDSTAQRVR